MKLATSIITLATVLYALFMPKRIKYSELYVGWLFVYGMELCIVMVLDFKYKLFGYVGEGVQWFGILIQYFIYPAVNAIHINYFPYKGSLKQKISYIFLASICFSLGEYIFLSIGFLYYEKWRFIYSVLLYPFLSTLLISNQLFFSWLISKNK